MGPPDILYQGSEIYEIWNIIAIPNSYILGWKPWELSVVLNPDPWQLSLNRRKSKQTLSFFVISIVLLGGLVQGIFGPSGGPQNKHEYIPNTSASKLKLENRLGAPENIFLRGAHLNQS